MTDDRQYGRATAAAATAAAAVRESEHAQDRGQLGTGDNAEQGTDGAEQQDDMGRDSTVPCMPDNRITSRQEKQRSRENRGQSSAACCRIRMRRKCRQRSSVRQQM